MLDQERVITTRVLRLLTVTELMIKEEPELQAKLIPDLHLKAKHY